MNPANDEHGEMNSAYFDIQADFGITKHMGGRGATEGLASMCHIRARQPVLEVGCGVGTTALYLARECGCRMTAVDISEGMVTRARERAKRRGLAGHILFVVADAQKLPFGAGPFAAVIDESVMAFVRDKEEAMREYARVAAPGGYIGLNAVTWTQTPPADLSQYANLIMAGARFRDSEGWLALLKGAGLEDLRREGHRFDPLNQIVEEVRQLDVREYASAWYRFVTQSVTNPVYRQFIREVVSAPGQIFQFVRNISYGLYVGRKAAD